jgi:hypothetical protein
VTCPLQCVGIQRTRLRRIVARRYWMYV